jgi:hypothetical protein
VGNQSASHYTNKRPTEWSHVFFPCGLVSCTSKNFDQLRAIMPIPNLDPHGLLPVGVHECSMDEVEQAFCWNEQRMQLFQSLKDFFAQKWLPLGITASFWVNGSFTRRKDTPEDIDIVADVSHVPISEMMPVVQLQYFNTINKAIYHVDFWFKHPTLLPYDLAVFFQYTGIKAGADLGLDAKHLKGILKVTP